MSIYDMDVSPPTHPYHNHVMKLNYTIPHHQTFSPHLHPRHIPTTWTMPLMLIFHHFFKWLWNKYQQFMRAKFGANKPLPNTIPPLHNALPSPCDNPKFLHKTSILHPRETSNITYRRNTHIKLLPSYSPNTHMKQIGFTNH